MPYLEQWQKPELTGGSAMGDDRSVRQSGAAKAMLIFKTFTGDRTELSLSEICERTRLASSTAHRWLQDLVLQGALIQLPSGRYCLSKLMWEIGTRSPHASILREIAMPFLQDLYQMTRGHVQLIMPAGDEALLVERLSKSLPVKPMGRVGGRLPLHATGAGKAILAYSPVEIRRRILSRTLTRYTPYTITSPQILRAQLVEIRRQGYAICNEERQIGIKSYAFPVFEHGSDNVVVAAVSVLVWVEPKQPNEQKESNSKSSSELHGVLDALRPAAQQISRALCKIPLGNRFDAV